MKQRERLTRKVEAPPHMLLMTATPIPRTLAIMQYGGMSLSTISQLPPGRTPVETHVVQDDDLGRQQVRRHGTAPRLSWPVTGQDGLLASTGVCQTGG